MALQCLSMRPGPAQAPRQTRKSMRVHAQAVATEVSAPPAVTSAATRVRLGDSDLLVSACCLGTMTWGQQNTEAEAHQQLSYAWDQGINFLDTAEMYPIPTTAETQGRTDRYIGTWLKGRKREDVIVATKVSGYSERSTWVRSPPRAVKLERQQILESVDSSLQRLQTDTIDLLQVHWPDRYVPLFGEANFDVAKIRPTVPIEEQLRALEEVVKAGKVRYIGVSNETSWGVCEWVRLAETAGLPKIVSIQNVFSMLNRGPFETNLAETCLYTNVSLLAYSPLAGGSLSGKYNAPNTDPKARLNLFPGYMERYKSSTVKDAVAAYQAVAAKYGLTATQLALAWCKSRWFVASSIIGATSMAQLEEDISAFSISLPPEAYAEVEAVHKKFRDPSLF